MLSLEILILGYYSYMEQSNLLLSLIPIVTYSNADIKRSQILSDNKGKSGIYMWTHLESSKKYISLAVDLSKRLKNYFNKNYLNREKTCISIMPYFIKVIVHLSYLF
jgi:hypothetical protein